MTVRPSTPLEVLVAAQHEARAEVMVLVCVVHGGKFIHEHLDGAIPRRCAACQERHVRRRGRPVWVRPKQNQRLPRLFRLPFQPFLDECGGLTPHQVRTLFNLNHRVFSDYRTRGVTTHVAWRLCNELGIDMDDVWPGWREAEAAFNAGDDEAEVAA